MAYEVFAQRLADGWPRSSRLVTDSRTMWLDTMRMYLDAHHCDAWRVIRQGTYRGHDCWYQLQSVASDGLQTWRVMPETIPDPELAAWTAKELAS